MTTTLTSKQQRLYTLEEYRNQEQIAEFRSEYRDGDIVAMRGGTINHNRIRRNICTILQLALRGKDAEVFMSDLRLSIPHYQRGIYPEEMVIQGEPAFNEERQDEMLNLSIIFEVLSPFSQNYDRENKFRFYRSVPELREYILVTQEEYLVEHYSKMSLNNGYFKTMKEKNKGFLYFYRSRNINRRYI